MKARYEPVIAASSADRAVIMFVFPFCAVWLVTGVC